MTAGNDMAYPSPIAVNGAGDVVSTSEHLHPDFHGLTKREAFAMAAMQGLLANPYYAENSSAPSGHDNLHSAAAWHADQQLLALNQEPRT